MPTLNLAGLKLAGYRQAVQNSLSESWAVFNFITFLLFLQQTHKLTHKQQRQTRKEMEKRFG